MALGIKILKVKNYDYLIERAEFGAIQNEDCFKNIPNRYLELWPVNQLRNLSIHARYSKAQLGQDLLALMVNNFKKEGLFVEIGAADGIHYSNTYLLERHMNWKGLCVEPAKGWHEDLLKNRTCFVDLRAVWNTDEEIVAFKETDVKVLSTISNFIENDLHAQTGQKGQSYEVETVTLNRLLKFYNFPSVIDYMSIDTEGSELEILRTLDWTLWKFNFISVEHNFTSNREIIRELLEQNGYERTLTEISDFDDYYIPKQAS